MPDMLAVLSQTASTMTFFDAGTHERIGVLDLLGQPHELSFDPRRRLIYCSHTYREGFYEYNNGIGHEISVIDPDRREVIEVIDVGSERAPHGLAIDPARDLLYASVEATGDESGGVLVIDLDSRKVVDRIPVGAPGPHWLAITPDGTKGYTTNKEAGFASVLDLPGRSLAGRIEVPGSEGVAVSTDGRYAYLAAPKLDVTGRSLTGTGLRVVDVATDRIVATIPTEHPIVAVHATSTGAILVGELRFSPAVGDGWAEPAAGRVSIFAPDTHALLGQVEVGRLPLTLHSSPDGALGYAANILGGSVTVLDLSTYTVVTELDVPPRDDAGAHGMAYIAARR